MNAIRQQLFTLRKWTWLLVAGLVLLLLLLLVLLQAHLHPVVVVVEELCCCRSMPLQSRAWRQRPAQPGALLLLP